MEEEDNDDDEGVRMSSYDKKEDDLIERIASLEFDSLEQSKKVAEYEKKIAEAQANLESNTADAVDYQILIQSKGLFPSSNRVSETFVTSVDETPKTWV